MTSVQTYQQYLSSEYPGFISFIENIILPIFGEKFEVNRELQQRWTNPRLVDRFDNEIRTSVDDALKHEAELTGLTSMIQLGEISLDNTESPIRVYDITINESKELSKNRKGIQGLIRHLLSKNSGAFMIFHYADKQWEWRFSYCWKGMCDEDSTNAKRFTYLLGPNQACKTAAQRFDKLRKQNGKINLQDIEEAFSVEQLSKEFFKRYKAQYGKFVGYIIGKEYNTNKDTWEDKEGLLPNDLFVAFGEDEKKARDYVKKLLGRIVFLHFLQKKGWMAADADWKNGDTNFMYNLFHKASDAQKANYLDEVLEPLFSDALNKKEREGLFFDTRVDGVGNVRIPFLGGGLFERDELDEPESVFPAKYFEDLFEFFTEFNFTIDENDPSDAEVGVDPEMLGMIFENLLEDNKDKGAFYTPKEIVQYMCKESLIAYLQTDVTDEPTREALRQFVQEHDADCINGIGSPLALQVAEALRIVKICDPAIGSGAFPMGLLKELFLCRTAVHAWAKDKEGKDLVNNLGALKRDIIQNSIYGVDIEKGAVDIARLRFWLSLIVDEVTPHSLPNMDFKIMQGNSLLELYKGVPLDDIYDSSRQMMLAFDEETTARMLLKEHMFNYFEKEDHAEKARILESIDNAVKSLVKAKTLGNPEVCTAIDALDLRNNQEFFLWHTWFNDVLADKKDAKGKVIKGSGGFDIVIGNPPYLRIQGIRDVNPEQADILSETYESATGSFDMYVCFAELALNIINKDGIANFIMPLKWSNAAFGKGLRGLISKKKAATKIINFGAYQVFNASTYTALQWFKPNSKDLQYNELDRDLNTNSELGNYLNLLDDSSMSLIQNSKLTKETWVLTAGSINKLLAKLDRQPRRVSDVFDKIFQGLATSRDDTYFLQHCTECDGIITGYSKDLDKNVEIEVRLVRPLLKGEDVHKYDDITTHRVVIFPYKIEDGKASLYTESELSELFPKGYAYLKECESILRNREHGRLLNDELWYRYIYPKNLVVQQLEKLVAPDISMGGNFAYDEQGDFYQTTTIYGYVKVDGVKASYRSLMAIMNSQLCWWFIQNTGAVMSGGFFRYKPAYLNPFPMPSDNAILARQTEIETLVDQILDRKRQNPPAPTAALEHEIDRLVYDLYGLTLEEIAIVEGTNNA